MMNNDDVGQTTVWRSIRPFPEAQRSVWFPFHAMLSSLPPIRSVPRLYCDGPRRAPTTAFRSGGDAARAACAVAHAVGHSPACLPVGTQNGESAAL